MSLSPISPAGCRGIAAIALLTAATLAQAQAQGTAARTGPPDPLDPQARVPAAVHTSSLASYRPLGDDQRLGWKQTNETVNRIGGWRTYLREAQQPDPAPTAPAGRAASAPAPIPAPAPAPAHGGHAKH